MNLSADLRRAGSKDVKRQHGKPHKTIAFKRRFPQFKVTTYREGLTFLEGRTREDRASKMSLST